MRGKLSLVLLTAALLSVAGVAAAQPCEPTCSYVLHTDEGLWADLPLLAPFLAVGAAVAVTRVHRT